MSARDERLASHRRLRDLELSLDRLDALRTAFMSEIHRAGLTPAASR